MKNNFKIWISLSFIVVFAAGAVCGVLFHGRVLEKGRDKLRRERDSVHFPSLETMAGELKLTSDQQEQIKQFFGSNEERFKNLRNEIHTQLSHIRTQLITDIKSVLDEGQNEKFDALVEKYMAQKIREHDERKSRAQESQRDKGENR